MVVAGSQGVETSWRQLMMTMSSFPRHLRAKKPKCEHNENILMSFSDDCTISCGIYDLKYS